MIKIHLIYIWNLFRNRGYTQKIFTDQDRIAYFVQPGFETNYPKGSKERGKIERSVRNDYIENLRNNCYQETLHGKLLPSRTKLEICILAEHKLRRAQLYGDSKMVQQAQQTPRPNCKRLDDIQNNAAAGGWSNISKISCRDSMMLQFQRNLQKSNVDNAVQNSSFVSLFSSKLALYEYIYFVNYLTSVYTPLFSVITWRFDYPRHEFLL